MTIIVGENSIFQRSQPRPNYRTSGPNRGREIRLLQFHHLGFLTFLPTLRICAISSLRHNDGKEQKQEEECWNGHWYRLRRSSGQGRVSRCQLSVTSDLFCSCVYFRSLFAGDRNRNLLYFLKLAIFSHGHIREFSF